MPASHTLLNAGTDRCVKSGQALFVSREVDELVLDFPVLVNKNRVLSGSVDLIVLDRFVVDGQVTDRNVLEILAHRRSVLFDHLALLFGGQDNDHALKFLAAVLVHGGVDGLGKCHDRLRIAVGDPSLNLWSVLVGAWEATVGALECAGHVLRMERSNFLALVQPTINECGCNHRHSNEGARDN